MFHPRFPGCFLGATVLLLLSLYLPGTAFPAIYDVKSVPNVQLRDKNNFVSNPDGIIKAEDIAAINQMLRTLREKSGVEVAVVALENIGDNEARSFATDLLQYWGVGKKGEDNGLLILLVTTGPQRSVVFETGYGLEEFLPDAICFRIQQQYMIPYLKEGKYSLAMRKGIEGIMERLDSPLAAGQSSKPEADATLPGFFEDEDFIYLVIIIVFVVIFMFGGFGGGRGGRGGPRSGGSWGGGSRGGGSWGGGGSSSRF
jgi:uncharacterized protein